ncbi:signal peptidase I [Candidatus Uhrbacteria bacterium]|nr:signal peptidase I [Candidatus Uhrbacteria bacterium]
MKEILASNKMASFVRDSEHYLGRIAGIFLHIVLFLFFVRFFIVDGGISDGASMEPTIKDNKIFFIEKVSSLIFPFQRFDLIQHADPQDNDRFLVKRIVGLPGETVIFRDNGVFIRPSDSEEYRLTESYLRRDSINTVSFGSAYEYTVPANSYFVLGDNRQSSRDSRVYGPVHRALITGKVFLTNVP